jgi:hypothetical protein
VANARSASKSPPTAIAAPSSAIARSAGDSAASSKKRRPDGRSLEGALLASLLDRASEETLYEVALEGEEDCERDRQRNEGRGRDAYQRGRHVCGPAAARP